MNYNEMSVAQCSQWLTDHEKWKYDSELELWRRGDGHCSNDHPYKLTLDGAAGALREPWRFRYMIHYGAAWAIEINNYGPFRKRTIQDAPDELTARYRAAVAARMEEER